MSDLKKTLAIVAVLVLVSVYSYAGEDIAALFTSDTESSETPTPETTTPRTSKLPAIQIPEPTKGPIAPAANQLPTAAVSDPYGRYRQNVKGQSLGETLDSIQGSGIDEKKKAEQNLYFRSLVDEMRKKRSAGTVGDELPNQNPDRTPIVIPGISLNPPEDRGSIPEFVPAEESEEASMEGGEVPLESGEAAAHFDDNPLQDAYQDEEALDHFPADQDFDEPLDGESDIAEDPALVDELYLDGR